AHNLRTPLARVLGRLEKARYGNQDCESLKAAMEAASVEIMELITVSEKLLLIAEANSGLQRQNFSPVSLPALVEDVCELYEPAAAEDGIRLSCHLKPVTIQADPDLLISAITNLIDNAFKYAGSGSQIVLEVDTYERMARVSVTDDGPGVPDEE